jgi:hypothetical protein
VLLVLGLAHWGCASDPPAAESRASAPSGHLEVQLDRPAAREHIRRPVAFIEVSGRAGTVPFFASDVVLAVDQSTVALLASGVDVDEDGVVGRNRIALTESGRPLVPGWAWTTDKGDTVYALQLRVARWLSKVLEGRGNRLGLVSLTFRARLEGAGLVRLTEKPPVVVPVGPPEDVLAVLDDFPAAHERRRTDLARMLERGAELLADAAPVALPARPRAILLLSLGHPSAPDGVHWSSRRAVEAAVELGQRNIALFAIPFGGADRAYLDELTGGSGGSVVPLEQVYAQLGASGPTDLRPAMLEIENVTLHEPARDLRLFPDGRFDAVLPVAPGANTLEIRGVLADGHRVTLRREFHFERGRPSAQDAD